MVRKNAAFDRLGWISAVTLSLSIISAAGCSNSDAQLGGKTKVLAKKISKGISNDKRVSSDAVAEPQFPSAITTIKNFVSSKINHGSYDFDFLTNESRLDIKMGTIPGGQASFVQSDRPRVEKNFQQVINVSNISEVFVPEDIGLVDILLVVDDSGSMQSYQSKLAPKLAPLMSAISNKNWRVAVTTTSYTSTKQKFATFNKGESNVDSNFQNYVNSLGTNGDGDERGIDQAKWGLDKAGFLRDGSSIAVLVVSDENNCKSGTCGPNQVQSLIDKISSLGRIATQNAKVYSIIVPKQRSECSGLHKEADHGADYQALSDLTGGVVGRICDADYSPILTRISADIAGLYMNKFPLQHMPKYITSLLMTVGNTTTVVNDADYELVGQNLVFKMNPPPNSLFRVNYDVQSSGLSLIESFDLGEMPYPGSLKVFVNNIEWLSGFNLVGTSIVFSNVPPSGASIKATWNQNITLERSFSLEGSNLTIDPDSLQATVNGQNQPFTKSGGTVIFDVAPEPNATVVIKYDLANLVYDFNPGPMVAGSFKAADQTGKTIYPVFSNNLIQFDMKDFKNGRIITLSYKPEWSVSSRTVKIPHTPIDGSVVLNGKVNGACKNFNVDKTNNSVLINCELPGETGVQISYDYVTEMQSSFSVSDVVGCEKSSYEVFVNQIQTRNFTVNGCEVSIQDRLSHESAIKINVTSL